MNTATTQKTVAEYVVLSEHVLNRDRSSIDLLCQQITAAQSALLAASDLLNSLSVGTEDGALARLDHADAVHELLTARRALRHLTRLVDAHADVLDDMTGQA
ncbi:hypothetical protein ACFOWE_31265 [Planomonospora corallina]|uniref:Uncharacterized protein n=1 Tax=Planomonospora corallina TaxID=1806052 RepID=A0ABV8IEY9_9ACTN